MILAHVGDSRAVLCQQGRAVRDLAALTVTNGPQVVKGQPSTWPQQMAQVRLTEDHKPGAPGVPTSFEGGKVGGPKQASLQQHCWVSISGVARHFLPSPKAGTLETAVGLQSWVNG